MYAKENRQAPFTDEQIDLSIQDSLNTFTLDNKKVLVVIPDTTRSGPTGRIVRTIAGELSHKVKKLDFLVALGTHPQMPQDALLGFLGIPREELKNRFAGINFFQHAWDDEKQLMHIGTLTADEVAKISGGLLNEKIPVTINRKVNDYDAIVLAGPVFPHEVVGFSGGYKYLFPGISGPHFLHRFHWLGALITNPKINGEKDTPVRALINRAAEFLNMPVCLICYVVKEKKMHGIFAGSIDAWSAAADLSAVLNIKYTGRSYHTVISIAPSMYEDIWTAGKCMYKLEPVVENGGTLIIYAPHVREVSYTHGAQLEKIGYHTRDYFLAQMEKFADVPGGILAHSTHVKGIGTFKNGVEKPRVNVVLATGIPEEICERINLRFMDWRTIDIKQYEGRESEGVLVVHDAGEVLYRLADGTVPDIDALG